MEGDGASEVGLGDSFLAAGTQYVVEGGGDGDDSQAEDERDEQPLREQVEPEHIESSFIFKLHLMIIIPKNSLTDILNCVGIILFNTT